MAKYTWQRLGIAEPPIVSGMYEYGAVWTPGMPQERQGFRYHLALGWFSYKTWGIKVYKECRGIHYGKVKDQLPPPG